MSGKSKITRKRLSLKEQLELIEDSLKLGFKQSKAALKWAVYMVFWRETLTLPYFD